MRAVIQRVSRAAVTIKASGVRHGIGPGLVTLLGVAPDDTDAQADWLAEKLAGLRIFEDVDGKMNIALRDLPAPAMLIVSQFTLYGDARKGRRPSFTDAAPPEIAVPCYQQFIATIRAQGIAVKTGEFGAEMQVEIVNDGPITLIIDTPPR